MPIDAGAVVLSVVPDVKGFGRRLESSSKMRSGELTLYCSARNHNWVPLTASSARRANACLSSSAACRKI